MVICYMHNLSIHGIIAEASRLSHGTRAEKRLSECVGKDFKFLV